MEMINRYKIIFAALILFMFPAFIHAQVAIIANKNISVKSIDARTLKNLYTLQSNELGSQKVKLFYLNENGDAGSRFLSSLGISLLELKKTWLKGKLTGNGTPPEMVTSEEAMLDKVASTPGAIGFIGSKSANGSVKVIMKIE